MLTLQFKNAHIYFCTEFIWEALDYKFKAQLNTKVTANQEDEYTQTLEVPVPILLELFKVATVQPEGVAAYINQEMLLSLGTQLYPLANIAAVQGSIADLNTWETTVNQVWQNEVLLPWQTNVLALWQTEVYEPWLAEHPTIEGVIYPDTPVAPVAPTAPTPPVILTYNEASQVLMNVASIDAQNKAIREGKILNGKLKILA